MSTPQSLDHLPSCPRCGEAQRVSRTVPSEQGFHCVCQNCWYAWHCNPEGGEDIAADRRRPPS